MWQPVVVDRVPAESGLPQLVEVAPIIGWTGLGYTDLLSDVGTGSVGFRMAGNDELFSRFRDWPNPLEVWFYDGADVRWAGEVIGLQKQGDTWNLNLLALPGALKGAYVEPDDDPLVFLDAEQTAIAQGLVDYWQAKRYAHVGLSPLSNPTGVTRDRTYDPIASDQPIMQRITELTEVIGGFDWRTDYSGRALEFGVVGDDRTNDVFIDRRNIVNADAYWSLQPDDFATVGLAYSSNEGLRAQAEADDAAMMRRGRVAVLESVQDVSSLPTLQGKAAGLLQVRSEPFFAPTQALLPRGDWDWAVRPGDRIAYEYDYGFGVLFGSASVTSLAVAVPPEGEPVITVEFL